MDFKKSFCWRSNLSNVNIIPAYARSENGCGKCHFLVSNRVRIWRPKNGIFPPPHQQFPGATPPPPLFPLVPQEKYSMLVVLCLAVQTRAT